MISNSDTDELDPCSVSLRLWCASAPVQRVLPVRATVQHPDAIHRGSDADAQPEGEGGHPALHRGAGPSDGPGRLRQLQRDPPRRLAHHHLDHRAQELRRP